MPVADYLVDKWLDAIKDPTIQSYVSLHYALPPANDPKSTELTATSYTRQRTYWTKTTRMIGNQDVLGWYNLPATAITHIGVFDGPYSSNLMFVLELTSPYVLAPNDSYELGPGELYLRFP